MLVLSEEEYHFDAFLGVVCTLVNLHLVCQVLLQLRVTGQLELDKRLVPRSMGYSVIDRTSPVIWLPVHVHRRSKPSEAIYQLHVDLALHWFSFDVKQTVSVLGLHNVFEEHDTLHCFVIAVETRNIESFLK